MEEKELFEEIKPLIEEYKKYANQETPDLFNDFRANSLSKVQEKAYGTDREGEILKTLDEGKVYDKKRDDVITISYQVRRELIEELIEIRETKKAEMRSTIFEKVDAFISESREKVKKEIEEKRKELEEQKEEKRKKLEKKQEELEEKKQLRRAMNKKSKALEGIVLKTKQDLGSNDPVYFHLEGEMKKSVKEKEDLSRDINVLKKECQTLQFEYEDFDIESDEKLQIAVQKLKDFEEIYNKIDFKSEEAIESIEIIIEKREIEEVSEAKGQDDKWIDGMDRQILEEKLEQRLTEIEEGNEDLLGNPIYMKFRNNLKKRDNLNEILKILEGKKLLDIYKGTVSHLQENSKIRQEVERIIGELEAREKEKGKVERVKEEDVEEIKTPKIVTMEELQKEAGEQEAKEPKAGEQKAREPKAKPIIDMANGQIYRNGEQISVTDMGTIMDMQERQILEEELEQRLAEIEEGNEDLLTPGWIELREYLMEQDDIEKVLKDLEGKKLKDIYEGQIPLMEEGSKEREELQNIINELETREEIDPDIEIRYRADLDKYVVINKDTNERTVMEYENIQKMPMKVIVKKYELYDSFIEGIDPAIVGVLEKFDEKNRTNKTEEYLKTVTERGKLKEDREEDMKAAKIAIKYNLKGLYDKKMRIFTK